MTAALIAEALAHAEANAPREAAGLACVVTVLVSADGRIDDARTWITGSDGERRAFVCRDVMNAALAHLAEQAERAEAASRFDVAAYRHRLRVLRMRYNTDANRWAWAAILRAIEILDGMVAGAEVDVVESLNAAIEEDGRG